MLDPKSDNKILIVGPSWLGDMIMAQSLFKQLHVLHQNITIDVLAPKWCKGILARMPEVNKSIELPIGHGELALGMRYAIGQRLRDDNYSQAIVLPNSFKSALIPWFAKIKKRTGWIGECRYGLLNDHRKLDKSKFTKMVERFVSLAYPNNYPDQLNIQNPSLQSSKENIIALKQDNQLSLEKPILAICPGASFGIAKCWPKEYYAKVASHYLSMGFQVWLLGSEDDSTITNFISKEIKNQCHNFAGQTSLEDAVDLLSLAKIVVSNDSGLMHLSAALDIPLVALYGSTPEGFAPPLTTKGVSLFTDIECRPCQQKTCPLLHHKCMRDMPPELIINTIDRLIA